MNTKNNNTPLLNESEIIDTILDHIENKTTDLADEIWQEPTSNYSSTKRFEDEIKLMRQYPTPFCLSIMLPENGSYITRNAAGTPLLVARGEDGIVRAFRNACRHRGMPVAEGRGCQRQFTCPYHAWCYKNDGNLRNIPQKGFPGLKPEQYGLSQVRAKEKGGIIFIIQEGDASWDSIDNMPDFFNDKQDVVSESEYTDKTNWKLIAETSMEGYHIQSLHKKTFYPYGFANLNVVENFGDNSRIIFPFKRIKRLESVEKNHRKIDGLVTMVYQLFPNTNVITMSKHSVLVILDPIAPDQTKIITYRVNNIDSHGEKYAASDVLRDIEFVKASGLDEDRDAAIAIQASIAANANEYFTFGLYEKAIVHFHQTLNRYLS